MVSSSHKAPNFKNYFSNNWQWLKSKHKSLKVIESNAKIGVLINNEFELKLYQDTIKLIGNCIVFYNGNIDLKEYDFKSEKIHLLKFVFNEISFSLLFSVIFCSSF